MINVLSAKYHQGSRVERFNSSGIIALETEDVTGIDAAKPKSNTLFIVESHSRSVETWEGKRKPKRDWFPGSVAFLPAGSVLTSVPDHPYRENVLMLDSSRLIAKTRAILKSYKIDPYFCEVTSNDVTALARMLHELVSQGEHHGWQLMFDGIVLSISVAIARRFSIAVDAGVRQMETASGLTSTRLRRVFDYVEANLGGRIQLSEMADAAALSPYHFSRSFKKATGKSPARYVMERRVREAMALLQSPQKSLAEIAHECGFASQSHFADAFKAEVGVTPREFRRILVE